MNDLFDKSAVSVSVCLMYSHKATTKSNEILLTVLFIFNNVTDMCMWYAGACVSWRLTAANSYKETTVIQYIAKT